MKFSDETLMAYADGELDAQTRAAIEEAMSVDAEVARAIDRHRNLGRELRAAFDPMLDEPAPDRLLAAARTAPANERANIASIGSARQRTRRGWSWPEWGAMAASLMIGIVIARFFGAPDDNFIARDGAVIAGGALAAALDAQASGMTTGTGGDAGVHVALTYRARSGEYCRAFTVAETAGIACRADEEWNVRALAETDAADAGENYRMAGTVLPALILQTVQESIDGEALDGPQEAAARERGWQN